MWPWYYFSYCVLQMWLDHLVGIHSREHHLSTYSTLTITISPLHWPEDESFDKGLAASSYYFSFCLLPSAALHSSTLDFFLYYFTFMGCWELWVHEFLILASKKSTTIFTPTVYTFIYHQLSFLILRQDLFKSLVTTRVKSRKLGNNWKALYVFKH